MSSTLGPDAWHARLISEGRLEVQLCASCARRVFPPRTLCPHCGGGELAFRPVSGLGTVYSTTVVRQRDAEGGPYNLALVDLDEGVRLMSRIEGLLPQDVRIGLRVRARIAATDAATGSPLVVFDPA